MSKFGNFFSVGTDIKIMADDEKNLEVGWDEILEM